MANVEHLSSTPTTGGDTFAFLRDLRFIRAAAQIIFAVVVVALLAAMWLSVYNTLRESNLLPTFDFLQRRSGFPISESPASYTVNSTFQDAFLVGVRNTLRVVSVGLVGATVLGVMLGIFLLSTNWLVRTISRVYVEILRNTPLLVQLIFWYFVVMLGLPADDITLPSESVMVFPLRYAPYLITLFALLVLTMQFENLPPRLMSGAFTAMFLAEAAFRLTGDSYVVIIVLAAVGAVLIYMARSGDSRIPEGQDGFVIGVGIFLLAQFVGHLVLDGLAQMEVIENARFIYGEVRPAVYLGRTGFVFPVANLTVNSGVFLIVILIGLIVAAGVYYYAGLVSLRTGRPIPRLFYAVLIVMIFIVGGWFFAGSRALPTEVSIGEGEAGQVVPLEQARAEELLEPEELIRYNTAPVLVRVPERNRFGRVEVGMELTPFYMALLLGLVIYTSAFIGEIVRAGIQAVPYGQIEAARALGLGKSQTLRLIILPQALRVIIPPLGNQYLNLAKNSSLAAAIAYADTYQVGTTIMNQSGQSITGFFLVLVVYLTMSLVISVFMNVVNKRFELVTR
jgi:His/Glu/Gln/Arg/opine family amino acid ABC transporter permease subunit